MPDLHGRADPLPNGCSFPKPRRVTPRCGGRCGASKGESLSPGPAAAASKCPLDRAWSLTIIATLNGFNDMDSAEVFRWQRDEFEACG